MKKLIIILLLSAFFFMAYATKPDDKTCIIEGVKAVWGDRTPTTHMPEYYEQFMNATSKAIEIKDWIFLKQINYRFPKEKRTVAYGAFRKVITTVKPME